MKADKGVVEHLAEELESFVAHRPGSRQPCVHGADISRKAQQNRTSLLTVVLKETAMKKVIGCVAESYQKPSVVIPAVLLEHGMLLLGAMSLSAVVESAVGYLPQEYKLLCERTAGYM